MHCQASPAVMGGDGPGKVKNSGFFAHGQRVHSGFESLNYPGI
jgi:hypothetical protein